MQRTPAPWRTVHPSRLTPFLAACPPPPSILPHAGRPPEPGDAAGAATRALLAQTLALRVNERVVAMQRSGGLPARETCDFIVVDRWVLQRSCSGVRVPCVLLEGGRDGWRVGR